MCGEANTYLGQPSLQAASEIKNQGIRQGEISVKKGNKDHIKVDCIKPRNGAGNPCLDHFGKKPQSVLKAMCEVTDSSATSNPRFDIY